MRFDRIETHRAVAVARKIKQVVDPAIESERPLQAAGPAILERAGLLIQVGSAQTGLFPMGLLVRHGNLY